MNDPVVHRHLGYDPPTDFGFVCQRCGLSDVGRDRLVALGFPPHPCPRCHPHFRQRDEEADQ